MDKYYYARNHDAGPGQWCVYGPDGFVMATPDLQKTEALIIGWILSGKIRAHQQQVLDFLSQLEKR